MSEKQLLSVLVRALGILVFLDGFKALFFGASAWLYPANYPGSAPLIIVIPNLLYGVIVVLAGYAMFIRPAWLLNLVWPPEPPD